MLVEDVLKAVQNKFPTCNVIIDTLSSPEDLQAKCNTKPRVIEVGRVNKEGVKTKVTVCTGSFNVYILKIEGNNAEQS